MVEPIGTITNMAGLGGVIGAAIAVLRKRESDASYVIRGTVVGGVIGIVRALIEALWS